LIETLPRKLQMVRYALILGGMAHLASPIYASEDDAPASDQGADCGEYNITTIFTLTAINHFNFNNCNNYCGPSKRCL